MFFGQDVSVMTDNDLQTKFSGIPEDFYALGVEIARRLGLYYAEKAILQNQIAQLDPFTQLGQIQAIDGRLKKIQPSIIVLDRSFSPAWNPIGQLMSNGDVTKIKYIYQLLGQLGLENSYNATILASYISKQTPILATAASEAQFRLESLANTLNSIKSQLSIERTLLVQEMASLQSLRAQAQALGLI